MASKDGSTFDKLYRGEWQGKYKSQSEADFALCCKLAFWSGRNESQIDRLFRKSGLYRKMGHAALGRRRGIQRANHPKCVRLHHEGIHAPAEETRIHRYL